MRRLGVRNTKGDTMQTGTKLYAFVLMPFAKDFDDLYQLGIKAACDEVGIFCERVDETHVLGPIYDKIVNAISKADIIIADLTGRNANVYYENGPDCLPTGAPEIADETLRRTELRNWLKYRVLPGAGAAVPE